MCVSDELLQDIGNRKFSTILADPPWRFHNSTGKMAPEHKRLSRYSTMSFEEIGNLPVESLVTETAHLYLWIPNALLPYGLKVMGFNYPHIDIRPEFTALFMLELNIVSFLLGQLTMIQRASVKHR